LGKEVESERVLELELKLESALLTANRSEEAARSLYGKVKELEASLNQAQKEELEKMPRRTNSFLGNLLPDSVRVLAIVRGLPVDDGGAPTYDGVKRLFRDMLAIPEEDCERGQEEIREFCRIPEAIRVDKLLHAANAKQVDDYYDKQQAEAEAEAEAEDAPAATETIENSNGMLGGFKNRVFQASRERVDGKLSPEPSPSSPIEATANIEAPKSKWRSLRGNRQRTQAPLPGGVNQAVVNQAGTLNHEGAERELLPTEELMDDEAGAEDDAAAQKALLTTKRDSLFGGFKKKALQASRDKAAKLAQDAAVVEAVTEDGTVMPPAKKPRIEELIP